MVGLKLKKGVLYPGLCIRVRSKTQILGGGFFGRSNRVILLRKKDGRGVCTPKDTSPESEEDKLLLAVLRSSAHLLEAVRAIRVACQSFEDTAFLIAKATTRAVEGNYHDILNVELWNSLYALHKAVATYYRYDAEVLQQNKLVEEKTLEYDRLKLQLERMEYDLFAEKEDVVLAALAAEGRYDEDMYAQLCEEARQLGKELDTTKNIRAEKAAAAIKAYEEVKKVALVFENAKKSHGLAALNKFCEIDISGMLTEIELSLKIIRQRAESILIDLERLRKL